MAGRKGLGMLIGKMIFCSSFFTAFRVTLRYPDVRKGRARVLRSLIPLTNPHGINERF